MGDHSLANTIDFKGSLASTINNGPTTNCVFELYLHLLLLPAFRLGEIAIVDDLSSQKCSAVIEKILSAGAGVLFLPLYSPDLKSDREDLRKD